VTPHTTFRAGVLTEVVTASAVMAGPLGDRLSAPIEQLVPEFEAVGGTAAPATLRHALTHGTGWGGNLSLGACPSLAQWRTSGTRAPALAPPGAIYQANPANYALVGLALERGTGKSFEHVVWQRVLDPLRMTWSTFNPVTAARHEAADGHDMNGRAVPIGALDCGVERPGLGLMTTIDDLADFVAMLDRGGDGLLTPGDVEEIGGTTAPSFYPSRIAGFGFERFRPTPEQPEILLAQGASEGFAQAMLLVPEYRFGVVVLENAEHGWPAEVAYETVRIFLGIEPRPRFTPGVAHLGGLTGTYRALLGQWPAPFGAPPWSRRRLLEVTRVQDTLLGRIDGGRIFLLSPVIDKDVLAARIDGQLHRLRFWRVGEKHRAWMVSSRSAAEGPAFVRLPE
jgi:CubicO group peptidase (beta-lactamase class C family)